MLFLRVRNSLTVAHMDGLCSLRGPQSFPSWQHWASLPLFESCPRGVDFSHRSHPTRPSSVVDLSATPSARCLEPAAEVRRDQLLPPEVSRTAVSLELCCPTREKVSREAAGQNELYVGRGTADSF